MTEIMQSRTELKVDEYELRVLTLDSRDKNRLLVPRGKFRLPSGIVKVGTQIERAARENVLSQYPINLPPMTSVARLQDVDGVKGYVIEPAGGTRVDLRNHSAFSVSAYDASEILETASREPEQFDATDIDFVKQFMQKSFRR